jgi:membrane protein implicated in regulation of membrane protease activity
MDFQTIWQFATTTGQSMTFFWIFVAGAGFTLVFFIFGEIFDGMEDVFHGAFDALHLDGIFHIDADGGPSAFSPRVLSVFVTVFGGAGFISSVKKLGPVESSLIGIGSGVVIASIFFMIFRWIHHQQSTSTINTHQLVGALGTVRTAIPSDGVGEVVVDYVGSRQSRSAKSSDGRSIGESTSIIVKEVRGQMLIVESQK